MIEYWGGSDFVDSWSSGIVSWGSVGDWSSDGGFGYDWSMYGLNGYRVGSWFTVDDSIETIVWVSGVFNDSLGSIGFDEGVASLDYITVTFFVLVFAVTGQTILYVVGEAVLWVWVVFIDWGGNDSFSYWSGIGQWSSSGISLGDWGSICYWGGVIGLGNWNYSSVGEGQDGGENCELQRLQ